jgi:hypothetical protein
VGLLVLLVLLVLLLAPELEVEELAPLLEVLAPTPAEVQGTCPEVPVLLVGLVAVDVAPLLLEGMPVGLVAVEVEVEVELVPVAPV